MKSGIILDHFNEVVSQQPNHVAVEHQNRSFTYNDLYTDYQFLSAWLNINTGDVVGVYLMPSYSYVVSIMAINYAGGAFLPLDVRFPFKRLRRVLDKAQPEIFVTTKALKGDLMQLLEPYNKKNIQILEVDFLLDVRPAPAAQKSRMSIDDDGTNYIIYTSGSTGEPKLIAGRHKGLTHFIRWEIQEFNLSTNIRVMQIAAPSFDVSLRDIFVPLLSGGTLYIPPVNIKENAALLADYIVSKGITLLHVVPSIFRLINREFAGDPSLASRVSLTHVLLAGEPSYGKDVNHWYNIMGYNTQLVNLYGPSETTLAKLFYRIPARLHKDEEMIPLGHPVSNTTVAILSEDGKLCPPGAVGEICIRTPFRSNGYVGNEEENMKRFVQNPLHHNYTDIIFKTGDVGKYEGTDNVIYFIGRKDDQVKISGNRVELGDVNAQVVKYKGVIQSVIKPMKNKNGELVLACYYTAEKPIPGHAIRTYLNEHLPAFMIPAYYVQLDHFPLTLNGKIDKKNLPVPEDLIYSDKPFVSPTTENELRLAQLITEVLGIDRVGMNYSFFEIGGHSIAATRIITRAYKEFGKNLSLQDLLQNTTLAEVALKFNMSPIIEKIDDVVWKGDTFPLSFDQKRIWLQSQIRDASAIYNIPTVHHVAGIVNVNLLQQALNILVNNYEILRTSFFTEKGEPVQKVFHANEVRITVDHFSATDLAAVEEIIRQQSVTPFDFQTPPLFRTVVISMPDESHYVVFVFHHLICDGWSLPLFKEMLLKLYSDLSHSEQFTISKPEKQYRDFVFWEQQNLRNAAESLRAFWKNELQNLSPSFPANKNYGRNWKAGRLHFVIDQDRFRRFENKAKEKSTAFTYFLANVFALFSRTENQPEIILGLPISLRDELMLQDQVGTFLNTVPVRMNVNQELSFDQLLNELSVKLSSIHRHKLLPYEQICEQVGVASNHELFNAMVVWEVRLPTTSTGDIPHISSLIPEHSTSKHDLIFTCSIHSELSVVVDYNLVRFDETTVLLMTEKLKVILDQVIDNPQVPIGDIDLYKDLELNFN